MRGVGSIRFDGIRQSIQPVLNLAGLLSNGIERTRVVGGVCSPLPTKLVPKVVPRCPAYLSHVEEFSSQQGQRKGHDTR
jgi:hypothetical protein